MNGFVHEVTTELNEMHALAVNLPTLNDKQRMSNEIESMYYISQL